MPASETHFHAAIPAISRAYARLEDAASLKLFFTILISSLNNGALAAGRLVLPMIALSMGASNILAGILSGLFTAVPMIFSVRFGRWVDRSGTLFPIIFSSALILASCLVFLIIPSRYALLPIAGMIGAGAVFAHVAAARAVTESNGKSERTRNLGYLVVSYSLFQFIGPMVASVSCDHLGATMALVTISGFSLLALIAVSLHLHNFHSDPPKNDVAVRSSARELLAVPTLRKWIFISSVFSAAQTSYPFVVSLQAIEAGLTASQAGLVLGAFALGTMISRLTVGTISRNVQSHVALTTALLISATVYALLPLAHDLPVLVLLSGLLGLPLGTGVPLALNLIYDSAPEGRANESVGLCMAVTNFFQTTAPLILGIVATGAGVAAMIWTVGMVLAAPAAFSGRPRKS
jgi:MFS family permease